MDPRDAATERITGGEIITSAEGSLPGNGERRHSDDEVELARVLESYLADLEAGRPADPERLIAAHPHLARPLRACLKVMHLAAGLSQSGGVANRPSRRECRASEPMPPMGTSALTVVWPRNDPPPPVLLPEPPEDDSPIVRTHSEARCRAGSRCPGATRCWVRSPAAAWASCSGPATLTWA